MQVLAQKRVVKKEQVLLTRDIPGLGKEGQLKVRRQALEGRGDAGGMDER